MTVAYPEMERVLVVNTAQLHLTLSKRKVIVMWYDLYNFKKVLLVLLLVKLHTFLTLLHGNLGSDGNEAEQSFFVQ